MKKMILALAALTVVFSPLMARGQGEETSTDGVTTLKIYAQYSDDSEKFPYDYAAAALAEYMPEVNLELDIMGQDDDMRLKTYAAAGNLPDIFVTNRSILPQLIEHGDLAPLNDAVEEISLFDKISGPAKKAFLYPDGNVYAIPTGTKYASAMYYNKALFAENGVKVPENFEEFLAAVKAFSAKDIIPIALFSKEAWPGVQLYDMLVTRELPGGLMKLDAGEASIDQPIFLKAAQKMEALVKGGLLTRGAFNTSYDEALALFTEGKSAMFLNGMWCVKDLGEAMADNVGIMPHYYPLADKGMEEAADWNMSGGSMKLGGFSVNANSKNLELAKKAAAYFSYKFAEGKTVKLGNPPMYTDSPETEVVLTNVHKEILGDSVKYKSASGFPWHLSNQETKASLEDAVNSMLAGGYSAHDFIADLKNQL